jgi:FlaA1/EpsC-like NDP-sugar epimerase
MRYNILITGGTGTIGRSFAEGHIVHYVNDHGSPYTEHNITIFSQDELAQVEMKREHPYFNYVIGDVREPSEVHRACKGMDYVFHFAAIKHVNICEDQPQEAIRTNVIGTMNVINACTAHSAKMINMSSDKAINPSNVYGITKAIGEKMVEQDMFVSIRSGNVLWSSGSVLPIWKKQIKRRNQIDITSAEMTRFFIDVKELTLFIWECRDKSGIFTVPMKSHFLKDIAEEFIKRYGNEKTELNVVGLRPGERLHEFRDEDTSSEHCLSNDLNYIFA